MALATGDCHQKTLSLPPAGAVLITFAYFRRRLGILARRWIVGQECPTYVLGADRAAELVAEAAKVFGTWDCQRLCWNVALIWSLTAC